MSFSGGTLTIGDTDPVVPIPVFEIYGKYGVTDRIDLGLRYSNFSVITVDYKHQLFGDLESVYAIATGASVGGSIIRIDWDNYKARFFQYEIPVHLSIHPAPWFTAGISPKYTGIGVSSSNGFEVMHLVGVTPGIEIGDRFRGMLSYSYLVPLNEVVASTSFQQVAVGMKIRF